MRRKTPVLTLLCLMSGLILNGPTASAWDGPEIDLLRYKVTVTPSDRLNAMLTGTADSWNDLIRTSDLEALIGNGFTATQAPGFHIGFVGYNIRDAATIRSYYRPEIAYWPLHDVEFRHALLHCWDQLGIISSVGWEGGGYIATPVQSLVPPSQSRYYNPNVPQHRYNPGDPFTSSAGEHSSVGLLKARGYTFVDMDSSGTVTDTDYWNCPDGSPMPNIAILETLTHPSSRGPQWYFIQDLRAIGLGATASNEERGLTLEGCYYEDLLDLVYGTSSSPGGRFDVFIIFYNLGERPSHLYSLCHSSQDPRDPIVHGYHPANAPGIDHRSTDCNCEIQP